MMRDELAQVAEVVARALGRTGLQITWIDQEKVGIVRIRVVGSEHTGRKRSRRAHLHCIETHGVIVVLLGLFYKPLATRAEHRDLLSHGGLGRVYQRIESRPIRVGDGTLRIVLLHLEAHEVITLFGKPRLERIAACLLYTSDA